MQSVSHKNWNKVETELEVKSVELEVANRYTTREYSVEITKGSYNNKKK